MKTTNYGLNLTAASEDSVTFKAWRELVNGTGAESNMQILDTALLSLNNKIDDTKKYAELYIDNALDMYKQSMDNVMSWDATSTTLGGKNGSHLNFNDGSKISTIEDGKITIDKVETSEIDMGNYSIIKRYNGDVIIKYNK